MRRSVLDSQLSEAQPIVFESARVGETDALRPSDTDLTQQITAPVTYSISTLGKCWRIWWTHLDSNQGPLACEASALTGLSYASTGVGDYRAVRAASQERRTSAILMSSKNVRASIQENRIMGRLRQVSRAEATPE